MNNDQEKKDGRAASVYTAVVVTLFFLLAIPAWFLAINIISYQVSQETQTAIKQVNQSNQKIIDEIRSQIALEKRQEEERSAQAQQTVPITSYLNQLKEAQTENKEADEALESDDQNQLIRRLLQNRFSTIQQSSSEKQKLTPATDTQNQDIDS